MSKLKVTTISDPDNDNTAISIDTSGNVTLAQNTTFTGTTTFSSGLDLSSAGSLDIVGTLTANRGIGDTNTDTNVTGDTTPNFSTYQNFVFTLTGNIVLKNPATEAVGLSGFFVFIQDGTGSRTISLESQYKTAGAAGITLSTAAGSIDVVPYIVRGTDSILLGTPMLAFA